MFKTRLKSGIVLVALSLAAIISGGDILLTTLIIVSIIGMTELYRVLHVHKTPLGVAGIWLLPVIMFCSIFKSWICFLCCL